jgi:hypothetical protein
VVHGELPLQRYVGLNKNVGPQYVRGISEWSNDSSWNDGALWVAYSVNKEDIWVSRIPLGSSEDAWNTYSPKWAPAEAHGDQVILKDMDPYDYARAFQVFPAKTKISISFDVVVSKVSGTPLEIELFGDSTSHAPIRWELTEKDFTSNPLPCSIEADVNTCRFTLFKGDTPVTKTMTFDRELPPFTGISFRTGWPRPIVDRAKSSVRDDAPYILTTYTIQSLKIQ